MGCYITKIIVSGDHAYQNCTKRGRPMRERDTEKLSQGLHSRGFHPARGIRESFLEIVTHKLRLEKRGGVSLRKRSWEGCSRQGLECVESPMFKKVHGVWGCNPGCFRLIAGDNLIPLPWLPAALWAVALGYQAALAVVLGNFKLLHFETVTWAGAER